MFLHGVQRHKNKKMNVTSQLLCVCFFYFLDTFIPKLLHCHCHGLILSFIRFIMRSSPHTTLPKGKSLHDSMTSTWQLDILNVGMSLCQTRKLWSFMHMVHSEDKPQHRTNWHSCTWTGLRPTDQPQNCKQAQHWTMGERTAGRGEGVSDNQNKASQQTEDELKGSPQKTKKRQRCRTTTERDRRR